MILAAWSPSLHSIACSRRLAMRVLLTDGPFRILGLVLLNFGHGPIFLQQEVFARMGFVGSRPVTTPPLALPRQMRPPAIYTRNLSSTLPASTRPCLPRRV